MSVVEVLRVLYPAVDADVVSLLWDAHGCMESDELHASLQQLAGGGSAGGSGGHGANDHRFARRRRPLCILRFASAAPRPPCEWRRRRSWQRRCAPRVCSVPHRSRCHRYQPRLQRWRRARTPRRTRRGPPSPAALTGARRGTTTSRRPAPPRGGAARRRLPLVAAAAVPGEGLPRECPPDSSPMPRRTRRLTRRPAGGAPYGCPTGVSYPWAKRRRRAFPRRTPPLLRPSTPRLPTSSSPRPPRPRCARRRRRWR